jgi:UDP-N-acetylglucosamine--N-acetylmuramyl-(pentapeptide) pyrophosphoryl-undecaprenol N-acetylglucosamine transferase
MKILITGSHFTPAQAVMEELQRQDSLEIIYVGRKYTREGDRTPSAESQILPGLGIKFIPLTTGRLQRSFTIYTIPSLLKIPFGLVQALFLLTREKPDVVLSFGGYVAVPVVVAAWLLSIPVMVHEQTLVPGLANKISSFFASKIAISFPENTFAAGKTVLTGNPLRKEIIHSTNLSSASDLASFIKKAEKEKLPLILITGGNQGSHKINQTVGEILDKLTKLTCVIHQTGDSKFNDFEKLETEKEKLTNPERYLARKWLDAGELSATLRKVDLVVSRAGINTLSELAFLGIPALLIPIPNHKEQAFNAAYFKKYGLAMVLPQSNLSGETMVKALQEMLQNIAELKKAAKKARDLVFPDAAKRLALETVILAKDKHEK